jgi:hypothetical protein
MADDADITAARQEAEAALFARRRREPALVPMGLCYFCQSDAPSTTHLFCNTECRDDYEAEQRALARNGRR